MLTKPSHWKTNEVVSADKPQTHLADRHLTARFYRVHLHQALQAHVCPTKIHLSKAFDTVDLDKSTGELTISFTDGTTATADILLGADGIHSPVRRQFVPSANTKWTGWVTFRSVFPIAHVSHISDLPEEAAHFWGPDRTLFLSKLGKGLYTIVGSYQADPDAPDAQYKDAVWNQEGDVNVLREYYKDWSPIVRAVIDAVPYTRIYPNVAAHGLDSWVLGGGRVTLLGDAAHAHGGAFAAGGSLAIDDAWAFAASLFHVFPMDAERVPTEGELAKALHIYDQTRRPHTDRVLHAVHSGNKAKVVRLGKLESDEELRARMGRREDVTWLHEHDVVAAFKAVVENASGVSQIEAKL